MLEWKLTYVCVVPTKSLCGAMLIHSKGNELFSRKNLNSVIKLLSLPTTLLPFHPGFEIVLAIQKLRNSSFISKES